MGMAWRKGCLEKTPILSGLSLMGRDARSGSGDRNIGRSGPISKDRNREKDIGKHFVLIYLKKKLMSFIFIFICFDTMLHQVKKEAWIEWILLFKF